jgi:hypothetical protein
MLSNMDLELGDKENCPLEIDLPVSSVNPPLPKLRIDRPALPRTTKSMSGPIAISNNTFMTFMAASQPYSYRPKPQKTTPSLPSTNITITPASPSDSKPDTFKSPAPTLNSRLPYMVMLREVINYPALPSSSKRKRSGSDVGDDPHELGTACRSRWRENVL